MQVRGPTSAETNTRGWLSQRRRAHRLVVAALAVLAIAAAMGCTILPAASPVAAARPGQVWAWGSNQFGQLGTGASSDTAAPAPLSGDGEFVQIAAGVAHSLALKSDGSVWAWGTNLHGQLGDGKMPFQSRAPAQVCCLGGIVALGPLASHSLAIRSDGSIWGWGSNIGGQLGVGTTTDTSTPAQVRDLADVAALAEGADFSLALKRDGTVWGWGANGAGQLGTGEARSSPSAGPVQVAGLSAVRAIAAGGEQSLGSRGGHSLALKSDGTVWAWGSNDDGQLGIGSFEPRHEPVMVRDLTGVRAIAAGFSFNLALKDDGTVWSWGNNEEGQLGEGSTASTSRPVRVAGLGEVVAIAAGGFHGLALGNDGSVWAWGSNRDGQLGLDPRTAGESLLPVQVPGLSHIEAISAGAQHSLAIRTAP